MRLRPFRALMMASVLAVAAAACGGGDDNDNDDEPTATTSAAGATTTAAGPATTAGSTVPSANFTLRVTDFRLVNSEESDSGMRILLPTGVASATVSVTGLPTPNRVISVCQARELDSRLGGATCRMAQNGEEVNVALGSAATGVELVQVGMAGPGPSGNAASIEELTIRYTANSRELRVRLPQIAADAGVRPTFALTPASTDGAYRATLNWTVIPVFGGTPSNATLELVQGGGVGNSANSGGAQVEIRGTASGGAAAIRVSNTGGSALVSPKLSVLLP